MKGIVFEEFLEMVEARHGHSIVDEMVTEVQPQSRGIYTSVGTYDHQEFLSLVSVCARLTEQEPQQVLRNYGRYLFTLFVKQYPQMFEHLPSAFDLLKAVDNHVHVNVARLYPDAELPTFDIIQQSTEVLEMIYSSRRCMSALAYGLIEGTLDHYQEKATIETEPLNTEGSRVRFTITRIS